MSGLFARDDDEAAGVREAPIFDLTAFMAAATVATDLTDTLAWTGGSVHVAPEDLTWKLAAAPCDLGHMMRPNDKDRYPGGPDFVHYWPQDIAEHPYEAE